MKWSRRAATFAGLALIAITNVVALGGAAYNRSGEPESSLKLSQRELSLPYAWSGKKENSGLTLQLRWRVLPPVSTSVDIYAFSSEGGGSPEWLDGPKVASLGFDPAAPTDDQAFSPTAPHRRQLPRDVFVVLELDGPAYQEALRRAGQAAKEMESKNERGDGKKDAQTLMDEEEHLSSRLFAVDAGLDRSVLRSKFSDRSKYAIVGGQVRPIWNQTRRRWSGSLEALSTDTVNVPLEMRAVFEGLTPLGYARSEVQAKHFDATLVFGQRLEPWLVAAIRR